MWTVIVCLFGGMILGATILFFGVMIGMFVHDDGRRSDSDDEWPIRYS